MTLVFTSCGSDDSNDPDPTCTDGILNQDETDIDCGGVCSACVSCTDGIQNGDETDIDCGGSCSPCPSCTDGIQNGDETDVDCGGSCDPCTVPFSEFMTAEIDGVPFEANVVLGFDDLTTLEFQSDQSQDRQLFFVLPSGVQEGTYELVSNPGYTAEYKKILDGEFMTTAGTITITNNNTAEAELSGTFEFTAVEFDFGNPIDTVVVTNGAFGVEYF
ncbi:MAG: DUF6252 family protein [Saprospiraceae bacterium]